mmetsp:Transcript_48379/g.108671  ORF Transcript_48379/g.108671 Transcript_48379/m.108671 type:complete len:692 (+) Transcript_48379:41-2116(+)
MGQSVGTSCQGQLGQVASALASCNADLGEPCSTGCAGDVNWHQPGSCSLAEEELEVTTRPAAGASKYWFLHEESKLGTSVSSLYKPGGLVRVYKYDSHRQRLTSVQDVYDLDKEPCGQGTYGEVFVGIHRKTGVRRAIKAVNKSALRRYLTDSNSLNNFVWREVEILRHLDHPNIVRLYEAYEDEQRLYLIMELLEGGDLLERVAASQKRMSEFDAAALVRQMLGALQHIESHGCVHRDVKPENFLFTRKDQRLEEHPPKDFPVKLIDFGLSRRLALDPSSGRCTTPRIGTTRYMAPEAHVGKVTVALADRADMWSLGVVMHVIFTGYFPAPNLTERNQEDYYSRPCWSHLSREALDLLRLLLRVAPHDRPSVHKVLQHRWFTSTGTTFSVVPSCLSFVMDAVAVFASAATIRRLALVAAAREADESDLDQMRRLFQMLQFECGKSVSTARGGGVTLKALDSVASGQSMLKHLAVELKQYFAAVDLDGSGCIGWSEFIGVGLANAQFRASDPACSKKAEELQGSARSEALEANERDADTSDKDAWTLWLREDVCFRAFDLLSQSSGMVTGLALSKFLLGDQGVGHTTSGGASYALARCDQMLQEVDVNGTLNSAGFTRIIRGVQAKPPPSIGFEEDEAQHGWIDEGDVKAMPASGVGPSRPVKPPEVRAPVELDEQHGLADFAELAKQVRR